MKTLVILVAQRIEEETKNNNLRGRRGLEEERLHEAQVAQVQIPSIINLLLVAKIEF